MNSKTVEDVDELTVETMAYFVSLKHCPTGMIPSTNCDMESCVRCWERRSTPAQITTKYAEMKGAEHE